MNDLEAIDKLCERFFADTSHDARNGAAQDLARAVPDLAAEIRRLRAENERLHTFDGLLSLLDKHWPESVIPTTRVANEPERDSGARIAALIRWVGELRREINRYRNALLAAVGDAARLRAELAAEKARAQAVGGEAS